jgi:hypothetical protein
LITISSPPDAGRGGNTVREIPNLKGFLPMIAEAPYLQYRALTTDFVNI